MTSNSPRPARGARRPSWSARSDLGVIRFARAHPRGTLWTAFLLVHAAVAVLGLLQSSRPTGDVYSAYELWSAAYLHGGRVDPSSYPYVWEPTDVGYVGITTPWVYPILAIVPMLLPWSLAWLLGYTAAWAVMVTAIDAIAFRVLIGGGRRRGTSRRRGRAAWCWLAAVLLLGPVGIYRIEAVVVPIALMGLLWLRSRVRVASLLLAAAVWIKIWPAALVGAALVAVRRRWIVLLTAVLVSVALVVAVALFGHVGYALSFIGGQTDRGIQVESPAATVYLWRAMLGAPGSPIFFDSHISTYEIVGPGVSQLIWIMTPLQLLLIAVAWTLGLVRTLRGAGYLQVMPAMAIALVSGFIVGNKVGSPQYVAWLIPPVLLALVLGARRARTFSVLLLAIAGLTQAIYPNTYDALLVASPLPVVLVTLRNLLLVVLLIVSMLALVRDPPRRFPRSVPHHEFS